MNLMSKISLFRIIFIITFFYYSALSAATFTVVNTRDNGIGSLRMAIDMANNKSGLDTLNFDIKGTGPYIIAAQSSYPAFTDPIYINGYSQKGAEPGKLQIVITSNNSGTDLINGLSLAEGSDHSVITGLVVNNNSGYGIFISKSSYSRIEGNYIGTDITGHKSQGNNRGGLVVTGSNNITIGGDSPNKRNIVSGNARSGIVVENHSNSILIIGNYVGTDATGLAKLPNLENGVFIEASLNVSVGGVKPEESNVISGNYKSGIAIVAGSDKASIRNNYIGTDAHGKNILSNIENGIFIERSSDGSIGGSHINEKNIIAGNEKSGIALISQANKTKVKGNYIGILSDGITEAGNNENGIFIENSDDILIGGDKKEERNLISGNKQTGIDVIKGSDRAKIIGNFIGLGIDGISNKGNLENGIFVENSTDVLIGGPSLEERNSISNNQENGVYILSASNCILNNNYIGWAYDENIYSTNRKNAVLIKNSENISIRNNKMLGNGANGGILSVASKKIWIDNNYTGIFYSVLFLMVLVNIFLYTILRNDNFTYYLIYIGVTVLIILNLNGTIYDLYWPEWMSKKITSFVMGGFVLAFSIYTQYSLKLKKKGGLINDTVFKIFIATGICFIFSIFISYHKVEIALAIILVTVSVGFIFKPIRHFLKRGYLPAFYYLLACIVLFLNVIVQIFSNIGIIPHYESTGSFLEIIASISEGVFFSLGLGYQINLLKNENEKARQQIEEYLKEFNIQQIQAQIQTDQKVVKDKDQEKPQTLDFPKLDYKIKQEDVTNYFLSPLTERELDVLSLIASGRSNKEIADQLFVSVNTIKSHILKIYEKLDVNNRIQAVAKASSLDILRKNSSSQES